jgi:hypothetical protein
MDTEASTPFHTRVSSAPPESASEDVFNIRSFGAKGDGVHDDLPAYHAMVAAINAKKGGTAYFPEGVYFMDAHQRYNERGIEGGSAQPVFSDCDGLRISGYKAKIDLRANYRRSRQDDRHPISGIRIQRCRNFVIEGLEIDGNVDRLTRQGPVGETWSHGIIIASSRHYTLRDLFVHHHATDGIGLGRTENGVVDEDVVLENVRSTHNARQALSVMGVRRLRATNCDFSHTGRVQPYGGYPPGAGLDIEPEGRGALVDDCLFVNCRFENNAGGQVTVGYPAVTTDVVFDRCRMTGPSAALDFSVIFTPNRGALRNCHIDLDYGSLALSLGGKSDVTVENCTIVFKKFGIVSLYDAPVLVKGCYLQCNAPRPLEVAAPYVTNPRFRFIGNRVFRNAASFRPEIAGVADQASVIVAAECRDNRWETDFVAPARAPNQHFYTDYGATRVVQNERYASPAYRPFLNAPVPRAAAYSR